MQYDYNLNSRVVLTIKDNIGIVEHLFEAIDIIQNEKDELILDVEYYQFPDNVESEERELVREEQFICTNYDDFMQKITYIFSQDRTDELKYWNK